MGCGNVGILTTMKGSRIEGGVLGPRCTYTERVVGSVRVNGEQMSNATHLRVGALGRAFGPDRPHG